MKKGQTGYFIIASAIVWGVGLITCGSVLSGTPYKQDVTNILIGGASFHLLFIWAPLAKHFKTKAEEPAEEKTES
jgi:hypothetical protein